MIFALTMLAAAIGYGFRVFLSRSLSIDDYGLFYSVVALVATLGVFRELGLATSLVKHMAELKARSDYAGIKSATIMVFALQMLLTLVLFVPAAFFADALAESYFGTPAASAVLLLILAEGVINMGLYSAVFQGMQKFNIFAFVELVRVSLVFLFSYFLAHNGAAGIAAAQLLSTVVMNVIFVGIALRTMPFFARARFTFNRELFSRILKFGGTLWLGNVIVMAVSRMDVLILTYFRPLSEVALYNASLPTAMLLMTFASALNNTLFPTISELWARKETAAVSRGMTSVIRLFFIIMTPFALLLVFYSDAILSTLFGSRFAPATFSLQILAIATLFYAISQIFFGVINGMGRPDVNAKIYTAAAISVLAMDVALVPLYGVDGASAATAFSYIGMFLPALLFLRGKITVKMSWSDVSKITMSALLAWLAMVISGSAFGGSLFAMAAGMLISLSIYAFAILVLKAIKKADLEIITAAGMPIPKAVLRRMERFVSE
ncbi:MAG: flippase [Candidatus Aenigmarchaeota archaeon]|nr:flippase [Candidatus Aenigmarchaeota archaeon]